MTITASIYTDIYAIIMLLITIWLAKRNPIGNKYNNKIFISVSSNYSFISFGNIYCFNKSF